MALQLQQSCASLGVALAVSHRCARASTRVLMCGSAIVVSCGGRVRCLGGARWRVQLQAACRWQHGVQRRFLSQQVPTAAVATACGRNESRKRAVALERRHLLDSVPIVVSCALVCLPCCRQLKVECSSECPMKQRCGNQSFALRKYPPLAVKKVRETFI